MRLRSSIVLVLLTLAAGVPAASAQVAVIAHRSVPVDTIDRSALLDCYTGDARSWASNLPVVVFDLQERGQIKDAFYDFLGKSSARMKSLWLKRKLSGEGDPPEALPTEAALLERVRTTPGAIGFVRMSTVAGNVKVLAQIPLGER